MKATAALLIVILFIALSSCSKEPDVTTGATKKSASAAPKTVSTDSITLNK
ncbi:MAG: hypothetical protein WCJ03_01780 [Bacteroidales bacterium]